MTKLCVREYPTDGKVANVAP